MMMTYLIRHILNAPMWKYRMGVDYTPLTGLNFSVSFQHDDKFRSVQGFWEWYG